VKRRNRVGKESRARSSAHAAVRQTLATAATRAQVDHVYNSKPPQDLTIPDNRAARRGMKRKARKLR